MALGKGGKLKHIVLHAPCSKKRGGRNSGLWFVVLGVLVTLLDIDDIVINTVVAKKQGMVSFLIL